MTVSTSEILEILAAHDIRPEEDLDDADLPEIGEIGENEDVYTTSLNEVFREEEGGELSLATVVADDRLSELWEQIEQAIEIGKPDGDQARLRLIQHDPPEPNCAWYCPIHYFGHEWGIYVRERFVLSFAEEIALFVDWDSVPGAIHRRESISRQLLLSGFYALFLHEQFHHKVESLGFRFLVATGTDRYRPYKEHVYCTTYLSDGCLEESLANAESYRRLREPRYMQRVEAPIRRGLREFLKASFALEPPGYAEGLLYLDSESYRDGLYDLQSQVVDGAIEPYTPRAHWAVAPNMITALMDVTDEIYVVMPKGRRPIFTPTWADPRVTVSSRDLVGALTRHHGYRQVSGGKGSHIKLAKPGFPTLTIPGNRPVVSPGVVKSALIAVGARSLSGLPDLLAGRL